MLKFFQERKRDKLTETIKENQTAMYRIAYSYVHHEELAKDIVQDSILSAFKNLDALKEDKYMKTWLIRILINQSLDTLRKQKKNTEDTLEYLDNISAVNESSIIEYSDLYYAIDRLESKLKTVILLRFLEELKFDEIARITDTNINTVKAQVYRGLELLKDYMKEEEEWIQCTKPNRIIKK